MLAKVLSYGEVKAIMLRKPSFIVSLFSCSFSKKRADSFLPVALQQFLPFVTRCGVPAPYGAQEGDATAEPLLSSKQGK